MYRPVFDFHARFLAAAVANKKLVTVVQLKEVAVELFLYFIAKNSRRAATDGIFFLLRRDPLSPSSQTPRFISKLA